ncbi:Octanoyltransferase [Baekduia alba]|nr:Octanoyltransferase [Baekduia alba]
MHLGRVPYSEALALQQRVRAARQADTIPDTLLTLEHDPVYTRGRRSDPAELPFPEAYYAERGIEVVDVDRGGKVTYHGPGQLVAYPIVRVGDVMGFVEQLETLMVDALAEEGIAARGRAHEGRDFTGVWVGDRKIGSIGLHISHGVTMHGLSINVDGDLDPFTWIVACGLGDVAMTSVLEQTGRAGRLDCVRKRVAHGLAGALDHRQRLVTPRALERALSATPSTVG